MPHSLRSYGCRLSAWHGAAPEETGARLGSNTSAPSSYSPHYSICFIRSSGDHVIGARMIWGQIWCENEKEMMPQLPSVVILKWKHICAHFSPLKRTQFTTKITICTNYTNHIKVVFQCFSIQYFPTASVGHTHTPLCSIICTSNHFLLPVWKFYLYKNTKGKKFSLSSSS